MDSEEIKKNITMPDMVRQYGFEPNRKGFIQCPFHKEKTASMKIYKNSYYCYGCGESGDIFSFFQRMEDVEFKEAFKSLGGTYPDNNDYSRKLHNYHLRKRKDMKQRRVQQFQEEKQQVLQEIQWQKLVKKLSQPLSDDWCDAVNRLEYLYYLLDYYTTEVR